MMQMLAPLEARLRAIASPMPMNGACQMCCLCAENQGEYSVEVSYF